MPLTFFWLGTWMLPETIGNSSPAARLYDNARESNPLHHPRL